MQPQLAPLATSLLFASTVLAQAGTYNLTSTGCQDVDSYNTCTLAAASRVQTCEDAARAAQSEIALLACGCVYYIDMMNCYMASCWNKVRVATVILVSGDVSLLTVVFDLHL